MAIAAIVALALLFKRLKAERVSSNTINTSRSEVMDPAYAPAQNAIYDIVHAKYDVRDIGMRSSHAVGDDIRRNSRTSDSPNLSAQLDMPRDGARTSHPQTAKHSRGFNKHYLDIAVDPPEYSYVEKHPTSRYNILS